jgi:hypothetical protein
MPDATVAGMVDTPGVPDGGGTANGSEAVVVSVIGSTINAGVAGSGETGTTGSAFALGTVDSVALKPTTATAPSAAHTVARRVMTPPEVVDRHLSDVPRSPKHVD